MRSILSWVCGTCAFILVSPVMAAEFAWPQWRGPDRNDISLETGLLPEWPAEGPKRVWMFENCGLGYSGPAIAQGKLITLGAREETELVICLDLAQGKEQWTCPIGSKLENKWGDGPRGTAAIDGDRIYALGAQGILVCVQIQDGKLLWKKDLKDFGGSIPNWGYTESPLVDGKLVLCTPGGEKGTMLALDKLTGETVWQSQELTDPAHYSSIIVAVDHGQRQYIQLTEKHVFGVKADDGKVLWTSDWPGQTAVIPTPIYSDGKVYVTSGYGVGCKLIELGDNGAAREVYANKNMKNHHGGVIKIGDHLYGHSDGMGWVCQDFQTGEVVWRERDGLEKGCVTSAGGMLYCVGEKEGYVVLARATPEGWQEKGRFKLDPQTKIRSDRGAIWTHPVVVNGRLYLRDQDLVYCYDVSAQ